MVIRTQEEYWCTKRTKQCS